MIFLKCKSTLRLMTTEHHIPAENSSYKNTRDDTNSPPLKNPEALTPEEVQKFLTTLPIQEQYLWCIKNGVSFFHPPDDKPSGMPGGRMEGGVPTNKEI